MMRIPTPCPLGESYLTSKGALTPESVIWFQWSDGPEFTYFYSIPNKWHPVHFEVIKNPACDNYEYIISKDLLKNGPLKEKGYPLKGKGYAMGLRLVKNQMYTELILTDKYNAHIYIPSDETGKFINHGEIFVPPSWDTEEKRKSILLAKYIDMDVSCR